MHFLSLTGEQGSFSHGSVIDGRFEGFIQTHSGTFYVEPAERYIKDRTLPFHSVIYHEDDISEYFVFVLQMKYFFFLLNVKNYKPFVSIKWDVGLHVAEWIMLSWSYLCKVTVWKIFDKPKWVFLILPF